jgi:hypothetical protein
VRSTREYTPCSCGGLAWIERATEHGYRDRIHCPKCGRITVQDNIPMGIRVELKEWGGEEDLEKDSND